MEILLIITLMLFATVVIVAISDRFGLPWPVLITLVAASAFFFPSLPLLHIPAEMMLPIFLPPLLWALARRTSWAAIRLQWMTVVSLSVLLVLASAVAAAGVALWMLPPIGIAGALVLGAAVAPPDPVAVDAVAEPAGVPRRLTGTLQIEGLFNDAASIVVFHLALAALTAGEKLSLVGGISAFLYSSIMAVGVGWLIGYGSAKLIDWMNSTVARNAFTWVIPFATYVLAEEIHASGVIAIVIAAVELNSRVKVGAEDRLTGHAFWETVEMLFTGVAFGLIGLSVRDAVEEVGAELVHAVVLGVVISAVLIAVRFGWMWVFCQINVRKGNRGLAPLRLQEVLLLTWAGMRGLVTLALGWSIPSDSFPMHHQLAVVALVVLLLTMVIPGLTLPWLMRKLDLDKGPDAQGDHAREQLRKRAYDKAMDVIAKYDDDIPADMIEGMRVWFAEQQHIGDHGTSAAEHRHETIVKFRKQMSAVRIQALEAAQNELLQARREPGVDPAVVDEVLHSVDQMIVAANRH